MSDPGHVDLDEIIDAALRGETMLSAPMNFHRKVEERVRIAALKDRERARFRFWMLSLSASACGALFLAAAVVAVTNFHLIVTNGVSGGKGTFDYYLTAVFGTTFDTFSGSYMLATSVLLAAVALVLGWIPVRRLIGGHYKLDAATRPDSSWALSAVSAKHAVVETASCLSGPRGETRAQASTGRRMGPGECIKGKA